MTLIQSWIDSLQLLKPKNLKLFALVTLKSIIETYTIYFRSFWWAIALLICSAFIPYFFPMITLYNPEDTVFGITRLTFNHFARHTSNIISFWLLEFLFLAVCFCTRPSIRQKDASYFWTLFKKITLFWVVIVLLLLDVIYIQTRALTPLLVFIVLFFADSEGGIKNFFLSIWRSTKMIIFNLPLLALLWILIYFLPIIISNKYQIIAKLHELSGVSFYPTYLIFDRIISALFLPIPICIYANIYIKKVHDQFDLYFKQPSQQL